MSPLTLLEISSDHFLFLKKKWAGTPALQRTLKNSWRGCSEEFSLVCTACFGRGETRRLGDSDSPEARRNEWWNSGFVRLCNPPRYLVAIQGTTMKCREKPLAVTLPGLHPTLNDKEEKKQEKTGAYPWSLHQWVRAQKTPTMQIRGALAFSRGVGKSPRT